MRKRDISLLLSPSLVFIFLAVATLSFAVRSNRYHDAASQEEHLKKFEKFVEDVKAGKRQLTPDGMIDMMRRAERVSTSEWNVGLQQGEFIYWIGWLAAGGAFLQFAVVFHAWKQSRKVAGANPGLHWTRR